MKAMFAGRNDRGLELKDRFVPQPSSIRDIPRGTADGGNEPFVRIHANRDLQRQARHG